MKGCVEQFSKFWVRQQLFAFKEFWMEMRFSNIFKITNVTNLIKVIKEICYWVLQGTCKWKTVKQRLSFLKTVKFCPTFDIKINITWDIFREKLQNNTF